MLGSQSFELGPLNIPIWLVFAVGGYLIAIVVQRLFLKKYKPIFSLANDLLSTGVLVTLATWKLTPLVTHFGEIVDSPTRLLYYPGGTIGFIAGSSIAIVVMAVTLRARLRRADENPGSVGKVLVAAAVTTGFVVLPLAVVSLIPVQAQFELPAVEAPLLEPVGQTVVLNDRAEARPTVAVFWATWCGPCTAQMPEVQRFYEEHGQSIRVMAINLISTENGREAVSSYVDDNGYTIPVVLDMTDQARSLLAVRATPTTLVFDADGRERIRRTGAVTAAWIERKVLPLLR